MSAALRKTFSRDAWRELGGGGLRPAPPLRSSSTLRVASPLQTSPGQAKLLRCPAGDPRRRRRPGAADSATYGKWEDTSSIDEAPSALRAGRLRPRLCVLVRTGRRHLPGFQLHDPGRPLGFGTTLKSGSSGSGTAAFTAGRTEAPGGVAAGLPCRAWAATGVSQISRRAAGDVLVFQRPKQPQSGCPAPWRRPKPRRCLSPLADQAGEDAVRVRLRLGRTNPGESARRHAPVEEVDRRRLAVRGAAPEADAAGLCWA